MIPKLIHYCWFGGAEKPATIKKCIRSWRKNCPDYSIIEWNEDNVDISSCPLYVRQAYEAKKWAFVTDYIRLKVVYENGGIYLDTDVELIKNPNVLLNNQSYFGFEDGALVNTGLGFGAEKGASILSELMKDYSIIPFILPDGSYDTKSCPIRNTDVFLRHGLIQNNTFQILDNTITILPSEFLSPIDYKSRVKKVTNNTISIHWYLASWFSEKQKEWLKTEIRERRKKRAKDNWDIIIHTPNRIIRRILGDKQYEKLKHKLKH